MASPHPDKTPPAHVAIKPLNGHLSAATSDRRDQRASPWLTVKRLVRAVEGSPCQPKPAAAWSPTRPGTTARSADRRCKRDVLAVTE